ncbi:MAG: WYL domain-containing protein [Nitrospiraceae bacterium]|nr:MAG: WYL domain-containing protein [Nitrospiraceae bacterium]
MKEATDTILRQWSMLQKIPRAPGSIGTRELKAKLEEDGYGVDVRTIQRDLGKLSAIFSLTCEEKGKALRWCWTAGARVMDLPGMETNTALAFRLAEDHLAPLLPRSTLRHLEPHFQKAKEVLAPLRKNKLSLWPDKVLVIGHGPALTPPHVRPEVQDAVSQALLEDRQLEVTYKRKDAEKPKSYPINPLGLVFRDGVVYLVGTAKEYPDVRHFALHRMSAPKVLNISCRRPSEFDLHTYVKQDQVFAYPVSKGRIQLKALFSAGSAVHLSERLLSKDQNMTPQKDGRVLLQAAVLDTLELRWWLRAFGDRVEILAPKALREEFKAASQRMAKIYKSG